MLKMVLVGAVALGVALAAGCASSGGGDGMMMKCDGCKMEMSKDQMCPKDGRCMKCDKACATALMKCKGCSMEMSQDKMCGKCGACMKCDKCPK